MYREDIIIGQEYGYRERPFHKGPLERVRVLDRVRSQWEVESIDPNSGLQDFIRSNHLVIPWRERKDYLRDEASWEALERYCDTCWPGFEHPLSDAVDTILESTGETVSIGKCGDLSCVPGVLDRVVQRASLELRILAPGFVDRFGVAHLPFDSAVRLAQAFALAKPHTVLFQTDTEERKYDLKASSDHSRDDRRLPGIY